MPTRHLADDFADEDCPVSRGEARGRRRCHLQWQVAVPRRHAQRRNGAGWWCGRDAGWDEGELRLEGADEPQPELGLRPRERLGRETPRAAVSRRPIGVERVAEEEVPRGWARFR
jgi:hypothetical protein